MALFRIAYQHTNVHEGGAVRFPWGLTYRGIDFAYHPEWPGWEMIDMHTGEPKAGVLQDTLDAAHREFFLTEMWVPLRLDGVEHQPIANEIYDAAVLWGPRRPVRWLQMALNGLGIVRGWPALEVDGRMGQMTLSIVNRAYRRGYGKQLGFLLEAQRGVEHLNATLASPRRNGQYLAGWINRLLDEDGFGKIA